MVSRPIIQNALTTDIFWILVHVSVTPKNMTRKIFHCHDSQQVERNVVTERRCETLMPQRKFMNSQGSGRRQRREGPLAEPLPREGPASWNCRRRYLASCSPRDPCPTPSHTPTHATRNFIYVINLLLQRSLEVK